MGNVFISLDEEHEEMLRKLAQNAGGKKGALSTVIEKALDGLKEKQSETDERKMAVARMLARMKNAKKLGILNKEGKAYSSRDEIYAKRMAKVSRH